VKAVRGHRHFARCHRHRGGAAEPAQRAEFLQRAADERVGGLHPVQAGDDHREGEVTIDATEAFLRNHMAEFHTFIERVLTVLPRED
jgi:hypothetical protein